MQWVIDQIQFATRLCGCTWIEVTLDPFHIEIFFSLFFSFFFFSSEAYVLFVPVNTIFVHFFVRFLSRINRARNIVAFFFNQERALILFAEILQVLFETWKGFRKIFLHLRVPTRRHKKMFEVRVEFVKYENEIFFGGTDHLFVNIENQYSQCL